MRLNLYYRPNVLYRLTSISLITKSHFPWLHDTLTLFDGFHTMSREILKQPDAWNWCMAIVLLTKWCILLRSKNERNPWKIEHSLVVYAPIETDQFAFFFKHRALHYSATAVSSSEQWKKIGTIKITYSMLNLSWDVNGFSGLKVRRCEKPAFLS